MKKRIFNVLGSVLVIVSFLFIARRISMMSVNWAKFLNPGILVLLITMPFFAGIIVFINALCWKRSLMLFANRVICCNDAFAIYTKSNLAKYLPGNVGHYAARQMFGAKMGIDQRHLVLASLFEIGYSALSMLMLSFLFSVDAVVTLLRELFGHNLCMWLGVVVVTGFAVLITVWFVFRKNRYVIEIISLAKKVHFWLAMLGSFVLYSAATLIIGIMFAVIVGQYMSVDFQDALLLIGGSIASCFIGFITPGAPGGLGVREAAMLFLLAPFFPSETILLAAVIQRVIMIIGDAIIFPISLWIKSKNNVRTVT